jgi:quinol monooxygenase YgiN
MVYLVTYLDVEPASISQALSLVRQYAQNSASESGREDFHAMQEFNRSSRFVIAEAWRDEDSLRTHENAPHTAQFRSGIRAIQNSPADQRVHHEFSVADRSPSGADSGMCVVTHVDVPPPRKDETEVLLRSLSEQSRAENGCLRYDVFQQNAPRLNHFTVFAVWRDDGAFASHEAQRHTRNFREKLGPMLGAPYDERWYKELR